jgi:methylated-DNA-protein-cysteine methyltransferase-like protein
MDEGPEGAPRVVGPGFHARVYAKVREVPRGAVTTYGDVAAALGSARVARQVGWALAACAAADVPWWRVINATGRVSGRGDVPRATLQEALLVAEGHRFDAAGRLGLARVRHRFRAE